MTISDRRLAVLASFTVSLFVMPGLTLLVPRSSSAVICDDHPVVDLELVRFRQQHIDFDTDPMLHEFVQNAGPSADLSGPAFGGSSFTGTGQVTFPQTLRGTFNGGGAGINLDYTISPIEPYPVAGSASGSYTNRSALFPSFTLEFVNGCQRWQPMPALTTEVPVDETRSASHMVTCDSSVILDKRRWAYGSPKDWPETGEAFDEVASEMRISTPGRNVAFFPVYRVPRFISCVERLESFEPADLTVEIGETAKLQIWGAAIADATAVDLGDGIDVAILPDALASAAYIMVEATVGCLAEFGPRRIKLTTPRGVVESPAEVAITVTAPSPARSTTVGGAATITCPADTIELRNESPAAGTAVEAGQEQAFSAEAHYTLNTQAAAQIDLELRDQNDDLVGASPFVAAPGGAGRSVPLAIAPVEIPPGTTRLFLRARIVHEGSVLAQSRRLEYPVASERSVRILPQQPTVFAGDDLPIALEVIDDAGNLDPNYLGDVEVRMGAASTPGVGALKPAATGAAAPSVTVPITNGRGQAVLQTPEQKLTANSVITPTTVLEGTAALEASIVGRTQTTQQTVRVDSPLDLSIGSIEVLQAVKAPDPGTLVAFRPLVVRITVNANTTQFSAFKEIAGITATVRVVDGRGNDEEFVASKGAFSNSHMPTRDYVYVRQPNPAMALEREVTGADSLNVIVPVAPLEGDTIRLAVQLDAVYPERNALNNSRDAGPWPVRQSRTLRIINARAIWDNGVLRSALPSTADIARVKRFFALAYPISDGKVKFISREAETFSDWPPFEEAFVRRINGLFDSSIDGVVFFVDNDFFRFAGAQSAFEVLYGEHHSYTGPLELFAGPVAVVAATYCSLRDHCGTLAHELGHEFGFADTYDRATGKRGDPVEVGSFDWFRLHGSSSGSTTGPFVPSGGATKDFMGNTDEPWVDPAKWTALREKFELAPPRQRVGRVGGLGAESSVFVQGTVRADGTGILTSGYVLEEGAFEAGSAAAHFAVETLDAGGDVIDRVGFEPEFRAADAEVSAERVPFGFDLPFSDAVREIRLQRDDTVLDTRTVSANAPEIALDEVPGPSPLAGMRTVTWSADDPDADPVVCSLFYSPDGALQVPLIVETPARTYAWNTDASPSGSAAKLMLLCTDGVRSAMAERPVTLGNRRPDVEILAPADGAELELGESIRFEGDLSDLEDPFLIDPALEWRSDRQGVLGSGGALAVETLRAGPHVVTASGVDSDGESGTDSISIQVRVACAGDCDRSRAVSIDELIRGVNIALQSLPLEACVTFDLSGDDQVAINELVQAVNAALNGCPPPPVTATATPVSTGPNPPTSTPTAQGGATASATATATGASAPTRTATASATPAPPTPTSPVVAVTPTATATPTITPALSNAAPAIAYFLCNGLPACTVGDSNVLQLAFGFSDSDGNAVQYVLTEKHESGVEFEIDRSSFAPTAGTDVTLFIPAFCVDGAPCMVTYELVVNDNGGLSSPVARVQLSVES